MALAPVNYVKFRFRSFEWRLRIDDDDEQTVRDIKQLFKQTAPKFIRRLKASQIIPDMILLKTSNGSLTDDDELFYPLFQRMGITTITIDVEEAICVSIRMPQGQGYVHHGKVVFPSHFIEDIYYEIYQAQPGNIQWFKVKIGNRTLSKHQRMNDSVRNGDVLVTESDDPGTNYQQGPAARVNIRVKMQTGANERIEVFTMYLDQTIGDLMWMIRCRDPEWPMRSQRMVLMGRNLERNSRLRDCNIGNIAISLFRRNF